MIEKHYAHVTRDRTLLRRLAQLRRVTRQDVLDYSLITVTCSNPSACEGWIKCSADHDGYDPDDPDSPAYDEWEGVMIHGKIHDWHSIYGWVTEHPGCPVIDHTPEQDFDGIDTSRDGTYLLDIDWDDTACFMTVVRRVSDDPNWKPEEQE